MTVCGILVLLGLSRCDPVPVLTWTYGSDGSATTILSQGAVRRDRTTEAVKLFGMLRNVDFFAPFLPLLSRSSCVAKAANLFELKKGGSPLELRAIWQPRRDELRFLLIRAMSSGAFGKWRILLQQPLGRE